MNSEGIPNIPIAVLGPLIIWWILGQIMFVFACQFIVKTGVMPLLFDPKSLNPMPLESRWIILTIAAVVNLATRGGLALGLSVPATITKLIVSGGLHQSSGLYAFELLWDLSALPYCTMKFGRGVFDEIVALLDPRVRQFDDSVDDSESNAETNKSSQQSMQQKTLSFLAGRPESDVVYDEHAFDNLVGLDHAIAEFKDALLMPIKYPHLIQKYHLEDVTGILLYGPPGTGKTSLVRAVARYFHMPFLYRKTSEFESKWVGETEAALRAAFAEARQLAAQSPTKKAILFMDEIDHIAKKRDGDARNRPNDLLLTPLLEEMDGFRKDRSVLVVAATNRIDVLDPAILRPGRFTKHIEVGLPDLDARFKLYKVYLKNVPYRHKVQVVEDVISTCARLTEGASPADIKEICEVVRKRAAKRELENPKLIGILANDIEEETLRWLERRKAVSNNPIASP